MESLEFERDSKVAQALLSEFARQREEPTAGLLRSAAKYCEKIFRLWDYESNRAAKLDEQVESLTNKVVEESKHHQWFKGKWTEALEENKLLREELAALKAKAKGKRKAGA